MSSGVFGAPFEASRGAGSAVSGLDTLGVGRADFFGSLLTTVVPECGLAERCDFFLGGTGACREVTLAWPVAFGVDFAKALSAPNKAAPCEDIGGETPAGRCR